MRPFATLAPACAALRPREPAGPALVVLDVSRRIGAHE